MSNAQVGTVYQSIINDVIDTSRVDFEEGGVDDAVLERLRLGWQRKLTQLNVATFPWDPKPEPQPQIANPPTVPSNAGNYNHNGPPQHQQQHPQQTHGLSLPMAQNQNQMQYQQQQPRIKPEPEENNAPQPLLNIPGATAAQQRAAQHLQNNYGQRAAASINAIQGTAGGAGGAQQQQQQHLQHQQPQPGAPNPQGQYQQHSGMHPQQQQQQQQMHLQQQQQQPQQQQRPQGLPMPGQPQGQQGQSQPQAQGQGQSSMNPAQAQAQYRAMLARDAAQRQAQLQNQQPTIKQAQTDGAGDEPEFQTDGLVKQFDASGDEIAMGRIEIDGLLRSKILAMGQNIEGGGLMLPLKEASTKDKRARKVVKRSAVGDGQVDGGDDDDDPKDDEDAINSDLDDPDDGLNEDEDGEDDMGHIMLCMYDKVQRVKNKWKCVMKDGVLTVNGKEYVFHKASGEYEW